MEINENRRKFVKSTIQVGLVASSVGYWIPSIAAESVTSKPIQNVPKMKVSVRPNGRIPALYRSQIF